MLQNVELARRAYALLSDLTDRDPNDPAILAGGRRDPINFVRALS
jgi:hypothetical protein